MDGWLDGSAAVSSAHARWAPQCERQRSQFGFTRHRAAFIELNRTSPPWPHPALIITSLMESDDNIKTLTSRNKLLPLPDSPPANRHAS